MDVLSIFLAYAQDFELTYDDNNWERLAEHFNDDAIYQIDSPSMPCTLIGTEAIFTGMKKSLDGFDRRFDKREIEVGDDLKIDETGLSVSWAAIYNKADLPTFILKGRSIATLADNKIAELVDIFDTESEQALFDWVAKTGYSVDPSYQ